MIANTMQLLQDIMLSIDEVSSAPPVRVSKWRALSGYVINRHVEPTVAGGGFFFKALDSGTTGAIEPVWPTALGGTIEDGDIIWEAVSDADRFGIPDKLSGLPISLIFADTGSSKKHGDTYSITENYLISLYISPVKGYYGDWQADKPVFIQSLYDAFAPPKNAEIGTSLFDVTINSFSDVGAREAGSGELKFSKESFFAVQFSVQVTMIK